MDTHNEQGTNTEATNQDSVTLSIKDLARLTNQDATKLKELLLTTNAETGENLSSSEQYSILSSLMTDHFKQVAERNRNKGGKEILDSRQKQIAAKYEVDHSGTLEDVIQRIENTVTAKASTISDKGAAKMAELQEKYDGLKSLLEGKDKEINEIKNTYRKEAAFNVVKQKATAILKAENAMLSQNPTVQERQLNAFFETLKPYDYKVEGDQIKVLDQEGNELEKDYKTVGFKDFVLDKSFFDFADKYPAKPNVQNGAKPSVNSGENQAVWTEEQKKNYGKLYQEYKLNGETEKANSILKAGKEYFDKQKE